MTHILISKPLVAIKTFVFKKILSNGIHGNRRLKNKKKLNVINKYRSLYFAITYYIKEFNDNALYLYYNKAAVFDKTLNFALNIFLMWTFIRTEIFRLS